MQECSASPISPGAAVPAADLLRAPALPDQRSSTDFYPATFPCSPLKALGRGCSPHRRWMQPWSPSPGAGLCSLAGSCPLPATGSQMHTAGSLKIREKSLPLSSPGGAGNSLWSVHSCGVPVKTCSAGKCQSILPQPLCWWVYSCWRVKERLVCGCL